MTSVPDRNPVELEVELVARNKSRTCHANQAARISNQECKYDFKSCQVSSFKLLAIRNT